MEDHAAVRTFLRGALNSHGYHVFEADGEAQAFKIWHKHFHQIDLLLTDICIPYLTTGVELAKKFRKEKPWLQVIYMTGFSSEIVATEEIVLVENVNFFRKPFEADKLLDAVRKSFVSRSPALASEKTADTRRIFKIKRRADSLMHANAEES